MSEKIHLLVLKNIIRSQLGPEKYPEGSCYYVHNSYEVDKEKENVRKNLEKIAQVCDNILEIGFNAGHSALFMLLGNNRCKITCIDICEHPYTIPCFKYLCDAFPGRLQLIQGDSHSVLRKLKEDNSCYDAVHIDGSHDYSVANGDFFLSRELLKPNAFVIFDDINFPHLNSLWNGYIRDRYVLELSLSEIPISDKDTFLPTVYHGIGRTSDKGTRVMQCTTPISDTIVCSLAVGDEYSKSVAYGKLSKIYYCAKHNYKFHDDVINDTTCSNDITTCRPPAWLKIPMILDCLKQGYKQVVWIDADTYIMNSDITITHLFDKLSNGKDITVAQDDKGIINTGVMLIKNTSFSENFFKELWKQEKFINSDNWEQDAFIEMYKNNMLNCKENIRVLEPALQTELNSYHYQYRNGQFLVHLAGCYRYGKDMGLNTFMKIYCPYRMPEDTDLSYETRMYFLQK